MEERRLSEEAADRLISAIMEKLRANRKIIAQSLEYGRLQWRKQRNGEIEINLEPKL